MLISTTLNAADKSLQLKTFLDFETVGGPQISPDGKQIIYTRGRIDKKKDRRASVLWIMNVDGSRNRQLTSGFNANWSPDGTRIAFVKPDAEGQPQIFVRWMDAEGATSQVTHGDLRSRSMKWSPDGKQIAFVARVPQKNAWTIKLPARPKGAKWTPDPLVIDKYHYRQDRVGSYINTNDHLYVVPAEGGTPRQLTSGDWNVGRRILGAIASAPSLDWSPDGTQIVFDGNAADDWEKDFFVSQLYSVNIATGELSALTEGKGTWANPKFSPDGKSIAYSGIPAWNRTSPTPDLLVMDADGKNGRVLATALNDGPNQLTWDKRGRGVYFSMNSRGHVNLYHVSLKEKMRDVTKGMHVLRFSNISDNGTAVGTLSSFTDPADVVRFNVKTGSKFIVLTDVNADVLQGVDLGTVEEIWYTSTEGTKVQGWLVKPPKFDASKKYPLYLSIHGGPHAMYNAGFSFSRLEHAANGYVVLYTNPRGSTGYGDAFANAIQDAYPGERDYSDLMAGVDFAIEKGYIDTDRLYVEGCSGGGILTTWIVGQTQRFAAAVARCPVVNWISMASTTDVAGWATNFFSPPFWEDPTKWLEHSPIMHVAKVTTPVLLMTGDRDLRTPLAQAEEYYGALKALGIPTKLIPMRGEYHGTGSIPSNFMRTQLYVRKWFEEYAPKAGD
ncbi:MAG: peptidase S9 [Kordiimonadales bacterium]|nr:MAG: peptidase S9 [Kordiimonadales bacterium]